MDAETMARLLRLAEMRPEVPFDIEERVKRAFLDECRVVSHARLVRRRMIVAAALLSTAAVLVVAIHVITTRDVVAPLATVVATVERVEGESRLALGAALRIGERLEPGSTNRIGLRLANGASMRFDRGSRARFVATNRIELETGAVYIDTESDLGTANRLRQGYGGLASAHSAEAEAVPSSGPASSERPGGLEIVTALGIVKDIGTQFEIRLDAASLRVRVRSGVVEVHRGSEVSSARPGTELTVTQDRTMSQSIAPFGAAWAWAANLGPTLDADGRSLSAFLDHICREQGWRLVYADSKLAVEASGMILHGSTQGLPPPDALAVVLATTGLTHRLRDGELQVMRVARP